MDRPASTIRFQVEDLHEVSEADAEHARGFRRGFEAELCITSTQPGAALAPRPSRQRGCAESPALVRGPR